MIDLQGTMDNKIFLRLFYHEFFKIIQDNGRFKHHLLVKSGKNTKKVIVTSLFVPYKQVQRHQKGREQYKTSIVIHYKPNVFLRIEFLK